MQKKNEEKIVSEGDTINIVNSNKYKKLIYQSLFFAWGFTIKGIKERNAIK